MFDRIVLSAGIALSLVCLLGPGTALASVKCQCNNGAVVHAMSADYDDEDADQACNDACSTMGGGRVWSVDRDRSDGDTTVIREDRVQPRPAAPRR